MELRHLKILYSILRKYPYDFYAFGSRVKGTNKYLSDLDLCFMENIPWNILSHIDEDFDESDLPFKVDLLDWNLCDENFQTLVYKDLVLIDKNKQI